MVTLLYYGRVALAILVLGLTVSCTESGTSGSPDSTFSLVDAAIDAAPPDAVTLDVEPDRRDAALPACAEGQSRCVNGTAIADCQDDGTWASVSRYCGRGVCIEDAGDSARCDTSCLPGSHICEGRWLLVCDEKGESYLRVEECRFNCLEPEGEGRCVEACNGEDDDADDIVDEGYPVGERCAVGVGGCEQAGQLRCNEAGDSVLCSADPADPQEESCNGADDDCDGDIDEGFELDEDRQNCGACGNSCDLPNSVTFCNVGVCEFVRCEDGWADCNDSREPDGCESPGACGPDICDGVDDDGDDIVDEDHVPQVCGEGACTVESTCEGGADVCIPGEANPEFCNGVDDDCDGRVDEGLGLGEPCEMGEGICRAVGRHVCRAEVVVCDASPGAAEDSDQRCDGSDEDCDGSVDEDFESGACGIGACAGTTVCSDGEVACDGVSPTDESCNALDDDCDGRVDEGFQLGEPCSVGVGACAADGQWMCENGEGACSAVARAPQPDLECNGIDEDCDGSVDEGVVDVVCGIGMCSRAGRCVDGAIECEPGQPEAADAVCDGLDEDCDGVVDEGPVGGCLDGPALCPSVGRLVCVRDEAVCELTHVQLECRSLAFDGQSSFVEVPAEARFELTVFTLEAVMKFNAFDQAQASIVAHGESEGDEGPTTDKMQYDLRLAPTGNGGARLQLAFEKTDEPRRDRVESLASQTVLMPDRWYHVAAVRDAEGHVRIYIDGELDSETDAPLGSPPPEIDHPLTIGARYNNPSRVVDSFFPGHIEDIRIWSQALDAEQFGPCRGAVPDLQGDALVAWFRAAPDDEGAGMTEMRSGVHYRSENAGGLADGPGNCGSPCRGLDETCNGADDDCDGLVDEDAATFESVLVDRGPSPRTGAPSMSVSADGLVSVAWQQTDGLPRLRFGRVRPAGHVEPVLDLPSIDDWTPRSNSMAYTTDGALGILAPYTSGGQSRIVFQTVDPPAVVAFVDDHSFEGDGSLVARGEGFWAASKPVDAPRVGQIRAIDQDGRALGVDVELGEGVRGMHLASADGGGFGVVWEVDRQQVIFQRFNVGGQAVTAPIQLDGGSVAYSAVTFDGHRFLVVWGRAPVGGGDRELWMALVGMDGEIEAGPARIPGGGPGTDPQPVWTGDSFVVSFRQNGRLSALVLDSEGTLRSGPTPISAGAVHQQFGARWSGHDMVWAWSETNGVEHDVRVSRGALACPPVECGPGERAVGGECAIAGDDCLGHDDGVLCDDGDDTTSGDACVAGSCTGHLEDAVVFDVRLPEGSAFQPEEGDMLFGGGARAVEADGTVRMPAESRPGLAFFAVGDHTPLMMALVTGENERVVVDADSTAKALLFLASMGYVLPSSSQIEFADVLGQFAEVEPISEAIRLALERDEAPFDNEGAQAVAIAASLSQAAIAVDEWVEGGAAPLLQPILQVRPGEDRGDFRVQASQPSADLLEVTATALFGRPGRAALNRLSPNQAFGLSMQFLPAASIPAVLDILINLVRRDWGNILFQREATFLGRFPLAGGTSQFEVIVVAWAPLRRLPAGSPYDELYREVRRDTVSRQFVVPVVSLIIGEAASNLIQECVVEAVLGGFDAGFQVVAEHGFSVRSLTSFLLDVFIGIDWVDCAGELIQGNFVTRAMRAAAIVMEFVSLFDDGVAIGNLALTTLSLTGDALTRFEVEACRPVVEVCDGEDQDCDGVADNGFGIGQVCEVGVGACSNSGRVICSRDGQAQCSVQPGQPAAAEDCDNGLDDDCDGRADEGCAQCPANECTDNGYDSGRWCIDGDEVTCGIQGGCVLELQREGCPTGRCSDARNCEAQVCAEGATRACGSNTGSCRAGSETCIDNAWGACQGRVGPQNEACNGLDDDCDGRTDDGASCPAGQSCVAGQCRVDDPCADVDCGAYGECVGGACDCDPGYDGAQCGRCADGFVGFPNCRLPVDECDGWDDDQDNVIDEDGDCWQPIYRFQNVNQDDWARARCYHTSPVPPPSCPGHVLEFDGPVFYLRNRPEPWSVALHAFDFPGHTHILTRGDQAADLAALRGGAAVERGILGYIWSDTANSPAGTWGRQGGRERNLRRYSHPDRGVHIYPNNPNEQAPGWSFEGVVGHVWMSRW